MKYILIFIQLLSGKALWANPIEDLCTAKTSINNECTPSEIREGSTNALNFDSFKKWSWIQEKAKQKKTFLEAEIDNNKGMLRFLRDDYVDSKESREWYAQQYKEIRNDFQNLKDISKEIEIVSNKLNMCFKVCTPSMRVDNEEHLRKLQRLKLILLSKRPILAGPIIEEAVLSDNSDEEKIKKAFVETYSDYLTTAKNKIFELNQRFGKSERDYNFALNSRDELKDIRLNKFVELLSGKNLLDKHSSEILSEVDWRGEIKDSRDSEMLCSLYQENKDFVATENLKEISLEVAMVAAPFLVGPAFRLGVWGLKGAKLLKWGMREELYASVSKATAGISSSAFFLKDAINIPEKRKECEENLNRFISSKDKVQYQKYIECNQELSSDILFLTAETSLAGFSSLKNIMNSLKLSKGFKDGETLFHVKDLDELSYYVGNKKIDNANYGEAGFKLSSKKGDYYVLNLNGPKSEVSDISSNYWNFVSDTYRKRLNLTEAEVSDFIKSSKEMENRTTLLVSTEKNSRNSLRGGLAFVDSSNSKELLPFEKATGIKIERTKGKKIGEIVRFTVDEKKGDRELSDELVSQLFSYFKTQDKLDSVYIYTSKSHYRLYQRLLKKKGIKYELTHDLERDVVLEVNP
ncbi:hypothetical protein [Halobacteriovorax sp. JY17]|uniref:N-acyl amino acid synthase FeeM domain-containing protein n=1 Tax=Halobacteriovorax sp. JY17 TaxID=2014617 RepID=UPI000C5D65DB|nr:hypothetical protein [Halobacteriovorax sp. JY17]PIK15200.1 MAG: hypothetical protein CES88_00375 [Halobacteriovorax sp. JY17]